MTDEAFQPGVRELTLALRQVQVEYQLAAIEATMVLPTITIKLRLSGVESPLGELEDDRGNSVQLDISEL